MRVVADFSVTKDKNGNLSVNASSTVKNISGEKYSEKALGKMGAIAGAVQESAALMGFGKKTTQLMTALTNAESEFGTLISSEKAAWKASNINPLQLSGGRATLDLQHNIDGALDLFDSVGRNYDFAPKETYHDYSDRSAAAVGRFTEIYSSIREDTQVK